MIQVHNTTTRQAHLIREARNDRSIYITTDNSAKSTSRLSTYKPNSITATRTDNPSDPSTWTKATPTQPRHKSWYIIRRLCQYSRSKLHQNQFQHVKGLTYSTTGQDYKYCISCITWQKPTPRGSIITSSPNSNQASDATTRLQNFPIDLRLETLTRCEKMKAINPAAPLPLSPKKWLR